PQTFTKKVATKIIFTTRICSTAIHSKCRLIISTPILGKNLWVIFGKNTRTDCGILRWINRPVIAGGHAETELRVEREYWGKHTAFLLNRAIRMHKKRRI